MQMNLPDIKNSRIQRMLERLRPYAIEVTHVRGETNYITDHLSRNPRGGPEAEEFNNYTPITICNKSLCLMNSEIYTKDFYLQQVAEGASQYSLPSYNSGYQAETGNQGAQQRHGGQDDGGAVGAAGDPGD